MYKYIIFEVKFLESNTELGLVLWSILTISFFSFGYVDYWGLKAVTDIVGLASMAFVTVFYLLLLFFVPIFAFYPISFRF